MKQILLNLKTGQTDVVEVPCPAMKVGHLLIGTTVSLVSAGTEQMLVDFGKGSYLQKAKQQPDKVRQVLDKMRTDGIAPTVEAVFKKLGEPLPLGYCNVGRVIKVGAGVTEFQVGALVVSNGPHAEVVCVPKNLCARISDNVSDEDAAFTVVASIGLQGIRLARPALGEAFVVTGVGLIGLLTVQLLRANGCRVLAIDFDQSKLDTARQFGAETFNSGKGEDPVAVGMAFSRGQGVDGVIITASTKSTDPVTQAARMSRKRGRIVLVGVTGLELSRADFYEKELTFQVSCSYGPGRYDPNYEEKGWDYPVGFVRWTEGRNFEAVLDMMADGRLDVKPLISHRFAFEQVNEAYAAVGSSEPSLGILLKYPDLAKDTHIQGRLCAKTIQLSPHLVPSAGIPGVGFIGSGNYATGVLIPAFKAAGARLRSVASSAGVSGGHAGRKYGFEETTTDTTRLLADSEVDAVVICTRHDSHARFVLEALRAGKHVFVEKPLCLTLEELEEIEQTYLARQDAPDTSADVNSDAPNPQSLLMVGFNRRFAPQVQKMKALLANAKGPKSFVMTVNAGSIPADHWTQDPEVGGGRIIGEACHFIDLLRFLAGSPIVSHSRSAMDSENGDTVTLQLEFADGSIGTVHYFANGSKAFPKERLEVFCKARVLQLDNFRILRGVGWSGFKKMKLWRQDKGQKACVAAFIKAVQDGGPFPIPFHEIVEVTKVTFQLSLAD